MNPQSTSPAAAAPAASGGSTVLAWLYVGIPLAWGVSQTFLKALTLFK
ncbi:MAG: MFS transporter small subunit [Janthinobacterium lividum]